MERSLKITIILETVLVMLVLLAEYIFDDINLAGIISIVLLLNTIVGLFLFIYLKKWNTRVWYAFYVFLLYIIFIFDKIIKDIFNNFFDLGFLVISVILLLIIIRDRSKNRRKENIEKKLKSLKQEKKKAEIKKKKGKDKKQVKEYFKRILKGKNRKTRPEQKPEPNPEVKPYYEEKPVHTQRIVDKNASKRRHRFISEHFGSSLLKTRRIEQPKPIVIEKVIIKEPVIVEPEPVIEIHQELPVVEKPKPFIASKGGTKFHILTCMIARRISKKNRIIFEDEHRARKEGFESCGVCNPTKAK